MLPYSSGPTGDHFSQIAANLQNFTIIVALNKALVLRSTSDAKELYGGSCSFWFIHTLYLRSGPMCVPGLDETHLLCYNEDRFLAGNWSADY